MSAKTDAFRKKVFEEFKNFLVIFIYVWAILGLLALHKAFVLGHSPFSGQLFAVINALVLGKVILILEMTRAEKVALRLPPTVRVAIKSIIFGLMVLLFHIVEEGIRGWLHGKSFLDTLTEISGGRLMELGTLAILAIVALVPYFLLREIVVAIGGNKLLMILFPARSSRSGPGEV